METEHDDTHTDLHFTTLGVAANYVIADLRAWLARSKPNEPVDLQISRFIQRAVSDYMRCQCEGHRLAILAGAMMLMDVTKSDATAIRYPRRRQARHEPLG
jgi:hypothetical protein